MYGLSFNPKNIKELKFNQNEDGTFSGYLVSKVYDKDNQVEDVTFEIPRLDASEGLENLKILANNSEQSKVNRQERRHPTN